MRFIQEFGFTAKIGQEEAHQSWLAENEEEFARAHPEGTHYLGTFATVFTSDKQSGNYRSFVELDSYAALDRLAAAAKNASSEFGRLNREWSAFGDYDLNAPWSQASSRRSWMPHCGIPRSGDITGGLIRRRDRGRIGSAPADVVV